jgi:hypothetical protein
VRAGQGSLQLGANKIHATRKVTPSDSKGTGKGKISDQDETNPSSRPQFIVRQYAIATDNRRIVCSNISHSHASCLLYGHNAGPGFDVRALPLSSPL